MSGLVCLATMEVLIQTLALSALADAPTPPDANSIVIDDFESYTDEYGHRIYETWADGWETVEPWPGYRCNYTGASVGHFDKPFAEQEIVHGGAQSMPLDYNNVWRPCYSETDRLWETPQDWTVRGMNTLSLWFRGQASNSPEAFYVALGDSDRWTGVVKHPDPNALLTTEWQEWQIRLTTFSFGPVDLTAVKQLYIGIGDRQKPQPGGAGTVYIDDIRLVRCAPLPTPNEPDFLLIDDFESYTDEWGHRIFEAWIDCWETPEPIPACPLNCTGATVGHLEPPYVEQQVIHEGKQSMPMDYNNLVSRCFPGYSEAEYTWTTPQDWSHIGMNTLSLWFRGEAGNSPEPFYIALEDQKKRVWAANHPDPNALLVAEWQEWKIPLLAFTHNQVDVAAVKRMYIGVGDRKIPKLGGTGTIYIDDIRLTKSIKALDPDRPGVVLIDDFESYTDGWGNRVFQAWIDGWAVDEWGPYCPGSGTGATVGYLYPPFAEPNIVHSGRQSMPMDYNNAESPYYSEAYFPCYLTQLWDRPQNWTAYEANSLSLWFRGEAANGPEPFYIALEDSRRRAGVVNHPDPNAFLTTEWQQWRIPLLTFVRNKVDIAAIQRMYIGVGDRRNPKPGGTGHIYIDDIVLMRWGPQASGSSLDQ